MLPYASVNATQTICIDQKRALWNVFSLLMVCTETRYKVSSTFLSIYTVGVGCSKFVLILPWGFLSAIRNPFPNSKLHLTSLSYLFYYLFFNIYLLHTNINKENPKFPGEEQVFLLWNNLVILGRIYICTYIYIFT